MTENCHACGQPLPEKVEEIPPGICAICKKPMPEDEVMFRYHGMSGPCPED